MSALSIWKCAPATVKWTSLLWLVLGVGGIFSALFALYTFFRLPVTGMTEFVVIVTTLQLGLCGGVIVASWKFLLRASWGRIVLEIASWATLIYYVGFALLWVGSALANWSLFKQEIEPEWLQVSPAGAITISALTIAVFIAANIVVIRALRASSARQYVKEEMGS